MPPDDMTEAEEHMVEQERWGLSRSDMVLLRLLRLVKVARGRVQQLEDRVTALENRAR